jgi:hypothetical protein
VIECSPLDGTTMSPIGPKADIGGHGFPNLIKPLRMLRDGGNADEENQDADDVGLEPHDRIGVHG